MPSDTAQTGADTGFTRPAAGWFLLLDGGIAALAVLSASGPAYRAVRQRLPLPQQAALRALLAGSVVVHLLEGTAAYRIARRRGSPEAGRWGRQTLVVGFPSLRRLARANLPGD
ncbi:MAG TPA: DUF4499 domain-containing protein [Acidimicrobiales bacterium]|jgi:hypothetical protein|nr:DUF4499 domain-containing protein [Acidimicrobiales bacterium]